jgi:hypothetical protein
MLTTGVAGAYFFYAAPHLVWAAIATFAKPSRVVWHAGFIAASAALAAIASLWLGPQDSSGLPLQWILYWPLAAVLQLLVIGAVAVYRRAKRATAPSTPADV